MNKLHKENIDYISKYIEHDIVYNIYTSNKNNPNKKELLDKVKFKYQNFYKIEGTDLHLHKIIQEENTNNLFVVPENTDMTDFYIDKVKLVCNSLGLNVKVDPTEPTNENDYVIITNKGYDRLQNQILSPNNTIVPFEQTSGFVVFLKNNIDYDGILKLISALDSQEKPFNISTVYDEKLLKENKPNTNFMNNFYNIFVPDAPSSSKDSSLNKIDEIRKKFDSSTSNNNKNTLS
jgi:hypothetical protein